jgi:hypothetical protein
LPGLTFRGSAAPSRQRSRTLRHDCEFHLKREVIDDLGTQNQDARVESEDRIAETVKRICLTSLRIPFHRRRRCRTTLGTAQLPLVIAAEFQHHVHNICAGRLAFALHLEGQRVALTACCCTSCERPRSRGPWRQVFVAGVRIRFRDLGKHAALMQPALSHLLAGALPKVDRPVLRIAINLAQLCRGELEILHRIERVVELLHIASSDKRCGHAPIA